MRNPKFENLINMLSFFSTGKWAYEGISSSLSLYCWYDGWRFDEFNSTGHVLSVWLALSAFILAMSLLSVAILHVRDPWRGRWANLSSFIASRWTLLFLTLSVLVLLLSHTIILRSLSQEYHLLNYWPQTQYGGSNEYKYPNVKDAQSPSLLEYWSGTVSQSWCGHP